MEEGGGGSSDIDSGSTRSERRMPEVPPDRASSSSGVSTGEPGGLEGGDAGGVPDGGPWT